MARSVTLATVAREAGVSLTTASAALSDTGRVSAHTRERVRTVATSLGYRLDPHARVLRKGTSPQVGLVVDIDAMSLATDDRPALWWPRACFSLTRELGRHGIVVTLISTHQATLRQPLALDVLITVERPDGSPVLPDWLPFGTPVLLGGDLLSTPHVGRIAPNFGAALSLVMNHLRDSGAQRPALLRIPAWLSSAEHTKAAYRRWCDHRGITPIVVGRDGGSIDECVDAALRAGADAIHSDVPAAASESAGAQIC